MKVAQLIEVLQGLNPDTEVLMPCPEIDPFASYVNINTYVIEDDNIILMEN